MLELKEIKKDYVAGDLKVKALKGVSISFRQSEFVSILGPSGCGKTTLLNILSSFIDEEERIITIEDAAELRLHQSHVISLETRMVNYEGDS